MTIWFASENAGNHVLQPFWLDGEWSKLLAAMRPGECATPPAFRPKQE